jgi:hypothetical protein
VFVFTYKRDQGEDMSVPADKLMELMRGPKSAGVGVPTPPGMGDLPEPGAMSDSDTMPMASPMSTPEPKMGSKEAAMINLGMAMDLLEQSLPAIGSETEEGGRILNAIRVLNGVLGTRKNKVNELQQSEILQMLQTLPQAGGASPAARSLQQAPIPGLPPGIPQPPAM